MIGIIPIVKSSSIDEIYNELPVLVIKDWNELSVKLLNNKFEEINKCRGEKMYNFCRARIIIMTLSPNSLLVPLVDSKHLL